jgi:hypothetical protein
MNAMTSTTSLSDALRNVAMVADVSTSALGLTRTDKSASRKANQDHAAKDGAGKVVVNRFAGADEKIKKIMDLQTAAQANLKRNSMLWGQTKRRLLPNANFQRWLTEHTAINDAFELAHKELLDDADAILAAAKANIGTFNVDLPTKDDMRDAFSLSYALEPIPDPKQFGHVMGGNDLIEGMDAHLQHQFEENMRAAYTNAVQDTAERLAKPLENLAERMDAYDKRERDVANGKNPGKEGYFRDSIIENVKEISAVFGNLNVLGDSHLAGIAKKLDAFGKITPDLLRKRGDVRGAVAARAREVLKDLETILVR